MAESLTKQDKLVLDAPYIRRWRNQADEYRWLAEEFHRQREQLHQIELERMHKMRIQDILHMVAILYNPSLQEGLRLQKCLSAIADDEKFSGIVKAVVQVQDFEQFCAAVEEAIPNQNVVNAI